MRGKIENLALKTIAAQMPEAIILADTEGRVTWANPAFENLCGYTLKEVYGKKPGQLLQGKDTSPETAKAFRLAVKEGLAVEEDILNYHKDGCSYWARVSITPLRKANDELMGFIAIEREITHEHEQLSELHDELVDMYAAILHEELPRAKLKPGDPFYRAASSKRA